MSEENIEETVASVPVEPAEVEAAIDPIEDFRKHMFTLPGEWYVLHTYSGYEHRVATDIKTNILFYMIYFMYVESAFF